MNLSRKVSAVLGVLALAACGGSSADPPGDGDTGGSDAGTHGIDSGTAADGGVAADGATGSDAGPKGPPTNHRPSNAECVAPAPAGACSIGANGGGCTGDGACTSGQDGRCISAGGGVASACLCTYDTCTQDTDCASGQTCACHGSPYTDGRGSTCVTGNCRVDSDCGAAGYCSPSSDTSICGNSLAGYYCHTAKDDCTNDGDCPQSATAPGQPMCVYSTSDKKWECAAVSVCG